MMRKATLALAVCLATPHAAFGETVGLSAPLSGPYADLGRQLRQGAEAAGAVRLSTHDDACTEQGAAAAARRFVAEEVALVIGYICTEAIESALPILAEAGIPVVTPGVRTNSLTDRRERTGWPVFRMTVRADSEQQAVSSTLTERWRDELFAIVDDGTIYGRELAEAFRFAAEQKGLKPVFVDTFRPQLDNQVALAGRLRRAGATHVFVGGERDDIATLAQSAAELDYDLAIAGGEALRAEGEKPLRAGVLMIGLPEWSAIADPALVEALKSEGIQPEGYVLPGYAAAELAAQAIGQASTGDGAVEDALKTGTFETALGSIRFDGNGDMSGDLYRLFRYDGEQFVEVGRE